MKRRSAASLGGRDKGRSAASKANASRANAKEPPILVEKAGDIERRDDEEGDFGVSPASKRRRLSRRDSEEQVRRLVASKLIPKFGSEVVGRVGKSNVTVWEYMLEAWRRLKSTGRYWTMKNTQALYEEFDLSETLEDRLEYHRGNPEDIGDHLLRALATSRCKNPADRATDDVERLLETAGVLPKAVSDVNVDMRMCVCMF